MKKFFTAAVIGILFCSCGYKELSREEKFKLLYEAEILQKKDAREKLNKIYKKIGEKAAKNDEKALKEKEEYRKITYYLQSTALNYYGTLPSWGYLSEEETKYPSVKEIMGKGSEPVSAQFRLYIDNKNIYDYLTDELYTGLVVFRYGTGIIDEVAFVEKGKIKNIIQKNKFDINNKLVQEEFYDEKTGKLNVVKKYNQYGKIKEEVYILERYDSGAVKKDYTVLNGNEKGKVREYNKNRKVVKEYEM